MKWNIHERRKKMLMILQQARRKLTVKTTEILFRISYKALARLPKMWKLKMMILIQKMMMKKVMNRMARFKKAELDDSELNALMSGDDEESSVEGKPKRKY